MTGRTGEGPALIRVAAAQYPLDLFPSLDAYRDKIAAWVGEAAANGAELLVFPEYGAMELAGAFGARIAGDLAASLEAVSGALQAIDDTHADLARQHGVHILAASGPSAREGGVFVNAARLIAPSGRIGVQEKCIMTPFERDWGISPGAGPRVFATSLGLIGVAICYDSEFPLLVRTMTQAGARLILIPSCTEKVSGFNRVRAAARARALESTCVCVTSPTVGEARWSPAVDVNTGMAGVFVPAEAGVSPDGVLAEGRLDEPGWVYASVDLAALDRLRSSGEMRNDADWALQPGVGALPHVDMTDLR